MRIVGWVEHLGKPAFCSESLASSGEPKTRSRKTENPPFSGSCFIAEQRSTPLWSTAASARTGRGTTPQSRRFPRKHQIRGGFHASRLSDDGGGAHGGRCAARGRLVRRGRA